MHVGFVAPEFPPGRSANGVTTYTALMAEALARQGHTVSVFPQWSPDGTSAADAPNSSAIRVRRLRSHTFRVPLLRTAFYRGGRLLFPSYIQIRDAGVSLRDAVRRAHLEDPIDLIECPEARGIPDWLRGLDIPVVVRLHAPKSVCDIANGERRDRMLGAIARAERRCLKRAGFMTAPSKAIVSESERILALKLSGVRVIPYPCPTSSCNDGPAENADQMICFVGRLDLPKGFDVLIDAFKILASKPEFRQVKLRAAGPDRGLLFDGKLPISGHDYVRQTIGDDSIRSRVDLVGPLPHDQVERFRRSGCITVVASRFENFPYTVIEAMTAGCAVVASNAGGIPELVQHERNGLLFRAGDARDLAEKTSRLLVDADLRIRLCSQARIDVRERYNPDVVAGRMTAFYEQVLRQFAANATRDAGHSTLVRKPPA